MNLLALVESPDHVCCRYRIAAFAPALQASGCSLTCQGIERGLMARIGQFRRAGRYDAVILQRKLLPGWQLRILRNAARRLVFDFDDAVLYRDSNDPRGPDDPRRRRRFATTMAAADTVIAGNDFLADCALRAGARVEDVHVIPTCVDSGRYPAVRPGGWPEASASRLDLVWIGSASTLRGLEQPAAIWSELARRVPGLRLRVICDRFPRDFPIPVVEVPWSEADEARQIAAGDVGVSWLPDDRWSRGKCGLKVLQYQAAGLPVVANPVGCQVEMIHPGENGFLATSPAEWVDAIGRLAADPGLRARMGAAARRRLAADYSLRAWSDAFVQSTTGTGGARPSPSALSAAGWKADQPSTAVGPCHGDGCHTQAPLARTPSSLKPIGHR
ncbi:MAG: glycosyltransferase family 4 protein [Isosphaeraceae bacterium]